MKSESGIQVKVKTKNVKNIVKTKKWGFQGSSYPVESLSKIDAKKDNYQKSESEMNLKVETKK